ncbi:ATPase domain-containing protein [Roseateles amylovorans]|uniref:non-specific serine/threonine protein kinase n=1 Tax=Roseateles amylovorans TaxID=2978473 RepID=A0ABY6B2L5_9BURK|nr:ATPase domain-containing protein [Roseateles amylovorans]UXH79633.1 AAA family ATPase [Roseateles amylovorans]
MNLDRAMIRRLSTGVPGLDDVLGGGLPEFSFNLIAGPPGSGKTTLAHQLMFALATPERRALYFTVLGEPPIKMLRYQQQFDFFQLDRLNNAIRFVNLADDMAGGDLHQVLARIVAEVEQHQPGLVFVDSFRALLGATIPPGPSGMTAERFVHELGVKLASWQATTFLVGEAFHEAEPSPIFTVSDGLIWLRQSVHGNSMVRKMEIIKMRGQGTVPGLHTFRIDHSGLRVFAPQPLATYRDELPPDPLAARQLTGVTGLDRMLGGGLPRGYSVLVAGPSGSGKSLLAASFLVEGARLGEVGVLAAFEQRPTRSRGAAMKALVDSARIAVVDTRAQSLSVDELALLLIEEIRRVRATRVVIDSLSGFELALAPTFRGDFRESLARLVAALASTGATLMMTSELEDRYDDLRFSPGGTAFLTDAIILQRYVELDGRLDRLMAVVKLRGSAHAKELMAFDIDDDGLHVGQAMQGYEGLLAGRPRRLAPETGTA